MASPSTLTRPPRAKRPPSAPGRKPNRRARRAAAPIALPAWLASWRGEVLLVAAICAIAFAVRWPYLQTVPHFTDELVEVVHSAAIARGERFPLTAKDLYFGPVHYYILAGFIRVLGLTPELPRLVIMLFGVFGVVATYLLGRALAGRAVAALAALLLATSAQHTIVNSHVAWQNSTMPLYSTLCCLGFVAALNALRRRAALAEGAQAAPWPRVAVAGLIFAGFCFGITLQTHPGAIVLVPALVVTFGLALRTARAWAFLRSPWPYAAAGAALVAYAPPLVFNLTHGLPGLNRVIYKRDYAYEMSPTLDNYLGNLGNLLAMLVRTISDPTRVPVSAWGYVTPHAVLAVGAALAGLVLLARRGQWLPILALLSTVAIIPRYLRAYGPGSDYVMLFARYVAYLLPLLCIAVATAVVAALAALLRRLPPVGGARRGLAPALAGAFAAPLALALVAYLVVWPLFPMMRFYRETLAIDPNNRTYAATAARLAELRDPRTPILLDTFLGNVFNKEGMTTLLAVRYYLDIQGTPYVLVDDPEAELKRLAPTLDPADTAALPLVVTLRDRCWPIRDRVPLQRVSDRFRLRDFYVGIPSYYAIYRYTPGTPNAGCFSPTGPQEGD